MIKYNTKEVQALEIKTAKDLNITVKNIKYFKGHDGMQGINADLYHKNKKFATAYDDARGGGMDVRPVDYELTTLTLFKEIETKLRALPKYIHIYTSSRSGKPIGGKPSEYESQVSLDSIVDALALKKEEDKHEKQGIIYKENGKKYVSHWNMSIPQMFKKFPKKALPTLQAKYATLSAKHEIVNKDYLAEVGVVLDLV